MSAFDQPGYRDRAPCPDCEDKNRRIAELEDALETAHKRIMEQVVDDARRFLVDVAERAGATDRLMVQAAKVGIGIAIGAAIGWLLLYG